MFWTYQDAPGYHIGEISNVYWQSNSTTFFLITHAVWFQSYQMGAHLRKALLVRYSRRKNNRTGVPQWLRSCSIRSAYQLLLSVHYLFETQGTTGTCQKKGLPWHEFYCNSIIGDVGKTDVRRIPCGYCTPMAGPATGAFLTDIVRGKCSTCSEQKDDGAHHAYGWDRHGSKCRWF